MADGQAALGYDAPMANLARSSVGRPSLAERAGQAARARRAERLRDGEPSLAQIAEEATELVFDHWDARVSRIVWSDLGDGLEPHLRRLDAQADDEERVGALLRAPGGPLTSSGLAGLWLCGAVEADDAEALARWIQAGADPWALAVGGWHPLDWAWAARARACGRVLAQELMGEELHHIGAWAAREPGKQGPSIAEPFAASHPFMSSILVLAPEASGFAGASRTPCLSKLWRRVSQGVAAAPRGPSRFSSNLSALSRSGAGERPTVAKLPREQALSAWSRELPGGPQRAWVESLELEDDAPPGKRGQSARL